MQTHHPTIDPTALYALMSEGEAVRLIDVRTPAEFARGHAAGAESVPLGEIEDGRALAALRRHGRSLYLLCASGERARRAADRLAAAGLCNLVLVEGGQRRWSRCGLPVRREVRGVPVQGQVQIVLGALLLLARCALSPLLARMPWNRTPRSRPATIR